MLVFLLFRAKTTGYHQNACLLLFRLRVRADDTRSTVVGYFGLHDGILQYGGWRSSAASLAGINAKAATYHVDCLKGAPKTGCDYPTPWTIIQGPDTVSVNGKYIATTPGKSGYDLTVTQSYECSLKSWSESASCTMSVSISGSLNDGAKYASSTSGKTSYTAAQALDDLTVTAGLGSLTAPEATRTAAATAAGPVGALITAAPVVAAAVVALL